VVEAGVRFGVVGRQAACAQGIAACPEPAHHPSVAITR